MFFDRSFLFLGVCVAASAAAAAADSSLDLERAQYFGEFRFTQHYVHGHLYSSDDGDELFIHRFYYDGDGPGEIQINAVKIGENDYGKVNLLLKKGKARRKPKKKRLVSAVSFITVINHGIIRGNMSFKAMFLNRKRE